MKDVIEAGSWKVRLECWSEFQENNVYEQGQPKQRGEAVVSYVTSQ